MAARWDAYGALEVQDGASQADLDRAGKLIKELERAVADAHQAASATAAREESLRSGKATDTVRALKAEFAENVLRFRELEDRIASIEWERAHLLRNVA